MSLFGSKESANTCGAIVDVGSGSVGVAIVVSNDIEKKLDVVWSYREYMLIRSTQTPQNLLKEINTTIMNAMLELGSNGTAALRAYDKKLSIHELQVAICAPWSYTITRSINYKDEKPFEVTKNLIEGLIATARKETMTKLLDGKLIEDLGLRIITEATVQVRLNGYQVEKPIGDTCKEITLSHIHCVAQEKIATTLEEAHNKIVPKAKLSMHTFIYLYYQVLLHLYPQTSEICLIDVTNEATEIGIVRDNVLQHTTHVPYGMHSIIREIAESCSIPLEEAFSLLKDDTGAILDHYGQEQKTKIEKILTSYEEMVGKLFSDTGDTLSIPKSLFLHTSKNTESFFSIHLKQAAKRATGMDHAIHLFTSELLGERTMNDSALALSAHYFYTQELYITPLSDL